MIMMTRVLNSYIFENNIFFNAMFKMVGNSTWNNYKHIYNDNYLITRHIKILVI